MAKFISFARYIQFNEGLQYLKDLVEEAEADFLQMDSTTGIEPEPFSGETLGPISL
jgi:predicted HicB family RNase H-like nuclease